MSKFRKGCYGITPTPKCSPQNFSTLSVTILSRSLHFFLPNAFYDAQKELLSRLRTRLRAGPGWGAHDAPPDPLVSWWWAPPICPPPRCLWRLDISAMAPHSSEPLRNFFLHTAVVKYNVNTARNYTRTEVCPVTTSSTDGWHRYVSLRSSWLWLDLSPTLTSHWFHWSERTRCGLVSEKDLKPPTSPPPPPAHTHTHSNSFTNNYIIIIIIIRSRRQQRSVASTQSGHDDEPWTIQHECWRCTVADLLDPV